MARPIPPFATRLSADIAHAVEIAVMCERLRSSGTIGREVRKELTAHRTAQIYEFALLRVFGLWETFLEETFLRYAAGFTFAGKSETPVVPFAKTLVAARTNVFQGQDYLLWHNPTKVVKRAQRFFTHGRHETVVSSYTSRLEDFAAIRHRIAHDQSDAKRKFDLASMRLVGRRFPGSRPGLLLREWTGAGALRVRWLQQIGNELSGLASQLAG